MKFVFCFCLYNRKHDIVSKRSTDDGITWSPLNLVADAELLFGCHSYNSTPVGLCQFWDPTPVLDTSSNDIFLLAAYTSAADTSARRNADNDIFLWRSQDHGVSFTPDPNNFNISKRFGDRPRGTPANGHGIQLRSGRLLVPSYGHFGAAPSGSSVMYSDDHGRSWEVTSSFAPGSAEGDVAELNDGTVIYSMRSEIVPMSGCGDYFHCRLTARSLDKGLTFQNLTSEPSLPDPRSKGGIATTPKGVCVFANDANDENRTNVTVKVSRDGGYTWNEGQEVYTGMAGYVDVITKRETKAFVVYEKDECSIVVSPVKV